MHNFHFTADYIYEGWIEDLQYFWDIWTSQKNIQSFLGRPSARALPTLVITPHKEQVTHGRIIEVITP